MTPVPPEIRPPWALVRECFERALPLGPAERERLLADPALSAALAAEVRSLLAFETPDTAGGFLSTPAGATGLSIAETGREGERLGPWRITERLGSGGMGDVWRAERADGAYAGQAAVKVLKRGMDSDAVLARFALEQQSLARLSHPHIAHLIDAGRTADGLPYFVMELVQGRPIDQACNGLPLPARLRLFLQLADAVSHAHRNLLVHRDLKPGNVLVDGEGQVKLLDFGIAKALLPLEAGATTQQAERPFTPHYASPEQVRGEPVNTATDLYSLGVLLYVMLTGQRPYGRRATTPQEAARAVLEEGPTRPSSLPLADSGWLQTRRQLQGDLDNILLKALEKPIERRYPSVDALAADVTAFLGGYPVSARPASVRYVLAKFVARNRWAVAAGALGGLGAASGLAAALLQGREAAALGVLGLAGGLGIALVQARQAASSRDEAQRQLASVKQIATELVFRFGDAITLLPGGAASQEAMLQQTVTSLDLALRHTPDDPDLIVLTASALGRLAQLQGNPAFAAPERAGEADNTVARALDLAGRVWERRQGDWRFACQHLITLLTRAQLHRGRGDPSRGLEDLALAAERCGQALALPQPDEGRAQLLDLRANLWINTAHFNDHSGRHSLGLPQEALRCFALAEADFRALYGSPALVAALDRAATPGEPRAEEWGRHNIANVFAGRALVQQRLDDFAAMRQEAEAALALRRQNLAANPGNLTWRQSAMFDTHTLAIALLRRAEPAAALQAAQMAWDAAGQLLREAGPHGPWGATQSQFAPTYGKALLAANRAAEALPVVELGLQRLAALRAQADTPASHQKWAALQVVRGAAQLALGEADKAEASLAQAMALLVPLVDDAAAGRDARLALAEGHAWLARLQPASADAHRAAARAELGAAGALRPLSADCEALLVSLG